MSKPLFRTPSAVLLSMLAAGLLAPIAAGAQSEARLELIHADGNQPALTRATDVEIEVHGLIARTRVTQSFVNQVDAWVEGRYVFPLPDGATVDEFEIRIGERVIEGVVREKEAARRTFERARETGRTAGLVERHRGNLFSTRLTNIAPGEGVEVTIGFGQTVSYRHGEFRLRFPIPTLPRYDNGRRTEISPAEAPSAMRLAEEPLPPMPVKRPKGRSVQLSVALHAGVEIAAVQSLHHDVRIDGRGSERRIELMHGARGGRDFELVWRPRPSEDIRGAMFVEDFRGQAHALLMLVPPEDFRPVDLRRELVVVLDRSGSMQGEAFEQARNAVAMALERIGPDDRFNVIAFNDSAKPLFETPEPATNRRLDQALAFVAALQANGGTGIDAALARAMGAAPEPGYLRQIVFVTDGAVADEQSILTRVDRELADARLFAVGIGHGVNDAFLANMANRGRGTLTRIADPRDVAGRIGELLLQLESPVLEDLQVDWPVPAETWPERLPDLYAGEPVLIRARLDTPSGALTGGAVRVTGMRDLRFVELEWPISRFGFAVGVARAWAAARIEGLAARDERSMDAQLRADEMLLTALDYGVVSSLTSLAAVDRTPRRSNAAAMIRTEVTGTAPADRGVAIQALPATAAGSLEAGLRGLSILTIVVLLLFNRRLHGRKSDDEPSENAGLQE